LILIDSPARVDGLVEAGLNRVNISLDTVDRERFATISRRDRLADVVAGIDAAIRSDRHELDES
jgi:cyclic pyranopterin phosphate synthase